MEVHGFTKLWIHWLVFWLGKLIVPSTIVLSVTTLAVLAAWVVLIAAWIVNRVAVAHVAQMMKTDHP